MHGYLSDAALAALNHSDKLEHAATRYSVHESIKPNSYRKFPRSNAVALSDTLVTRADGTQYVIRNGAVPMHKNTRTKHNGNTTKTHTQELHERMMQLPSVHNPNGK